MLIPIHTKYQDLFFNHETVCLKKKLNLIYFKRFLTISKRESAHIHTYPSVPCEKGEYFDIIKTIKLQKASEFYHFDQKI